MEDLYQDEFEGILKGCDGVMQLTIKNYIDGPIYPNAKYVINTLISEGLLMEVDSGMYSPYLKLTPLGTTVVKGHGYKAFKEKILRKEKILEEREHLELKQLKQSVRINKWQFWVMIIGGFGGVISFLILLWQFFFGSNGFTNDIFK